MLNLTVEIVHLLKFVENIYYAKNHVDFGNTWLANHLSFELITYVLTSKLFSFFLSQDFYNYVIIHVFDELYIMNKFDHLKIMYYDYVLIDTLCE